MNKQEQVEKMTTYMAHFVDHIGKVQPDDIIQKHLITAIQKVGVLFEEKKYYLPQLIASAETMEKAITYLEPMLIKDDAEEKATIIMATVEGDIHDIGKNLEVLMLKNYV